MPKENASGVVSVVTVIVIEVSDLIVPAPDLPEVAVQSTIPTRQIAGKPSPSVSATTASLVWQRAFCQTVDPRMVTTSPLATEIEIATAVIIATTATETGNGIASASVTETVTAIVKESGTENATETGTASASAIVTFATVIMIDHPGLVMTS